MSAVEIVILVVAVIVAGAVFLAWGGLLGGGAAGPRSVRGRLRDRSERDSIDRDDDLTRYAPQGGHQRDPPGMRKPPNEGGLL